MIYKFDKKELTYKNITAKFVLLSLVTTLGLTSLLTFFTYTNKHTIETKYISEEAKMIVLNEHNEFSREKLISYLKEINLKFPYIVLAQAELETGNFKSKIFRENNNLFGMKVARKRPTTNKGEQYGHAYFDNWRKSVDDYAFYQAMFMKDIKTENQYFQFLDGRYAEDPNYIAKLKTKIIKLKKEFK